MASSNSLLLLPILFVAANATTFTVTNKCRYMVWAAGVPGGGQQLNTGETWIFTAVSDTTSAARIWARTGCNFNASGHGSCQTGDCGGVLQCTGYGANPNTLAEYSLNQYAGQDFYDISLVAGFNVPMEFTPASGNCKDIRCSADVNAQCPAALKVPGGCQHPCTIFGTDRYCCISGSCGPTSYSQYFKGQCPDAYSYPKDDATSLFTCLTGVGYKVVFCP